MLESLEQYFKSGYRRSGIARLLISHRLRSEILDELGLSAKVIVHPDAIVLGFGSQAEAHKARLLFGKIRLLVAKHCRGGSISIRISVRRST